MQDIRTKLIEEAKFAFLDTETTGLSPAGGARICEVAVSVYAGGECVEDFSALVNPGVYIPAEVSKIHGITNAMVAQEPSFAHIAPGLLSVLEGSVIVCHNADFDIPFIAYELGRVGLRLPQAVVLDTLKFARKHGSFQKNRLGCIVEELGFKSDGWHRALADVKMTQKVFSYFLDKFKEHGVKTVGELEDLQVKKLCKIS